MKTEAEIRSTIALLEAYAKQDAGRLISVPIADLVQMRCRIDTNVLIAAYLREVVGDTKESL